MKAKVLPFVFQLLSTLSLCDHMEDNGPTNGAVVCREHIQRSVLVSTVDGSLTALDPGTGQVLWSFSSQRGPLFSSAILQAKGVPHFIPGLDSHLYVLEGDRLQQLPITTDMLMGDDFDMKGSLLVGSKEKAVYGVNAVSGEVLYACEANRCVQFDNDSIISNIDTLKIGLQHTKVRGADSATGSSQWEFTIGRYKLGLVESHAEVESCVVSSLEVELETRLEVDVLTGVMKSVSKNSGTVFWTKQFSSPIVDTWGLNGGLLQKINLFNHSSSRSGLPYPSRLLGSYKGQLYVHPALPSRGPEHLPRLTASLDGGTADLASESLLEYRLVRPPLWQPPSGAVQQRRGSEVSLYNQVDYRDWATEGPAGHGVYFCTNESATPLARSLVAYGNRSPHPASCSILEPILSREGGSCSPSEAGRDVRKPPGLDGLSFVWSPFLLGSVIAVLFLLVLRSTCKRKRLEAENQLLRRQTTSSTGAGSPSSSALTPLSAESVVSRLVGETQLLPYAGSLPNGEPARTRTTSKSESSETSMHHTQSESRFKVDFEPSEELGRGGFGIVFKCKHKMDGIDYAVKRIKLPLKNTGREKVKREVKALAQLDHPNIVRYFSSWVERGELGDPVSFPNLSEEGSETSGFSQDPISLNVKSTLSGGEASKASLLQMNHFPEKSSTGLTPLKLLNVSEGELKEENSHSESFIIEFEHTSSEYDRSVSQPLFEKSGAIEEEEEEESSRIISGGCRDMSVHGDSMSDCKSRSGLIADNISGSSGSGSGSSPASLVPSYLYIQMQLCRKDSLKEWLRCNKEGRLRKTVMFYFEQILAAVCYVHSMGMMHRDLKPSNIFFSFDGSIKVGDFGLVAGDFDEYQQIQPARSLPSGLSRSSSDKGRTGNVGTHLYMSPEQVQDGFVYGEKVDIFALGIILYEMNHPFATEMERTKVLEAVKMGHIPNSFAEKLHFENELITWMLCADPMKRPSAGEIASSPELAKLKEAVSSLSPEENHLSF